jgi:uncharacterized repeat protein (TIGR01451 family)/MYXO-CTERM domain-containing protein
MTTEPNVKTLSALAFAAVTAIAGTARADLGPVPTCGLTTETAAPFLGSSFVATVHIDNTGNHSGFGPGFELFAPPGVTLGSATVLGTSATVQNVGVLTGGSLANPYTGEVVSGPVGFTYYFVRLPLTSQAPDGPVLDVDLSLSLGPSALLGVPLPLHATCGYFLGADALKNPIADPPIRTDVPANPGDQTVLEVVPSVIRLRKTATSHTATGPNFPIVYVYDVDVASGRTVTTAHVLDSIDPRVQVTGVQVTIGDGSILTPSLPLVLPGGELDVAFASLTGTAAPIDAQVRVTGFIPDLDAEGSFVLDPATGAAISIVDGATLEGAEFDPGTGVIALPAGSSSATLVAHSVLIRESITNLSRPGQTPRPGDQLQNGLSIHVSDYFDFDSNSVESTLGDGLTFVANGNYFVDVFGDDPTTVVWDFGGLTGNEEGGTRRSTSLVMVVDEVYANDEPVHGGDVIPTRHTLASVLGEGEGSPLVQDERHSGTDASVQIVRPTATKSVYRINGEVPSQPLVIRAGDVVTFRLQMTIGSGDQRDLVVTDFLPPPIFDATEHGTAFGPTEALRFGPAHSLPGAVAPSVSVDPDDNAVSFAFAEFTTVPSSPVVADLLLDYTVLPEPVADGLELTNIAQFQASGTTTTVTTAVVVAAVITAEPEVFLTKGAIGSTSTDAIFTPGAVAFPYHSTEILATPVVADVARVDAGDLVTFAVIAENRGAGAAHEVTLDDQIPDGFVIPAGGPNLRVTDGSGEPLVFSGDLFTEPLLVTSTVAPFHPTSGANLVVVRYDLEVAGDVHAQEVLADGVARLLGYAAAQSGPNFVEETPPSDGAHATIDDLVVSHTLLTPAGSRGTIGDLATYRTVVRLPEGTHPGTVVTVTVPAELAFTAEPVLTASPDLSFTGTTTPAVTGSGRVATFTLGTATNANRDDVVNDEVTIDYAVVILAASTTDRNDALTATAQAAITGATTRSANAAALTVNEPLVAVTGQTVTPSTADGGDTVRVQATVTNSSGTGRDQAHDVHYVFTLPAANGSLSNFTTASGQVPDSVGIVGNIVTVTWNELAIGATSTFGFDFVVGSAVPSGTTQTLSSRTDWSSQAGNASVSLSPYNALGIERTGDNTPTSDDYFTTVNTTLTIRATGLTNTLTSPALAPVGSLVTYVVVMNISEGTSPSLTLSDVLPAGLAFVGNSAIVTSPSLLCSVSCTPTPVVTASGQNVVWSFGDVSNPDSNNTTSETIALTITAVVLNSGANQSGTQLVHRVTSGATGVNATAITVVDPNLVATITPTPVAALDAGDVVTLSVRLRHGAASTAAAHDVDVDVTLPADLVPIAGSYSAGTCPGAASAEEPSFRFTLLPLATDCTFSFQVRLADTADYDSTLAFSGTAAYSSQAGDVSASRSSFNALGVERTGVSTFSGQVVTDEIATLVESFVATDRDETADEVVAGGERITYRLRVTLPEGESPDVRIVHAPPAGLRLVAASVDLDGFGGSLGTDPTNAALEGHDGQALTFLLGTVSSPGDNDGGNDSFSLLVTAEGVYSPAAFAESDVAIGASLRVGEQTPATASYPVDYGRPEPTLSLGVDVATPIEEQAILATATLSAGGDAPTCHPTITFAFPEGLAPADAADDGLDNDGDAEVDELDEAEIGTTVSLPGCLSGERQVRLRAVAEVAVTPAVRQITATLGDYHTLAGDAGQLVSPATDLVDNAGAEGIDDEDDAIATVEITPRAPSLTFTKVATDLDGDAVEPGDTIRFTISAHNGGTGPVHGVTFADTLPTAHASLVADSAVVSQGTVVVDGTLVLATVNEVEAGASVVLTFDMRLASPRARGTTVVNQALLDTTDGYGPLASDDPGTTPSGDPTVVVFASTHDVDGDGVPNEDDGDPENPNVCHDLDRDSCDDCAVGGLPDRNADGPDSDEDGVCDAGDGADDDADTDDDGVIDGDEPNRDDDMDGDGLPNVRDPDSDNDGILDGTERGVCGPHADTNLAAGVFRPDADCGVTRTDPSDRDSDNGGIDDGAEDTDHDGLVDEGETDPNDPEDDGGSLDDDEDGLTNGEELAAGTDRDDADSDDDGIVDGDEANWNQDTDHDGLINALDPDSDDDGLLDGTEVGLCDPDEDTEVGAGFYRPDGDCGDTTTLPLDRDTDHGGVRDGAEDTDKDGVIDEGERDPRDSADDNPPPPLDGDRDGLSDAEERAGHTDPADADTDDDGVLDGAEPNWNQDTDHDGVINARDPDSDGDGVWDGTERGVCEAHEDTAVDAGFYRADGDCGESKTAMVDPDSDDGGVDDGAEDVDKDGVADEGERDPNAAPDDAAIPTDSDDDGLTDAEELQRGSDPADADTDDDGVLDGAEPNWNQDTDRDGVPNFRDPDSDDDGILDGTEVGLCGPSEDTDITAGGFQPDADCGESTTSMIDPDSDRGGVDDGAEDPDKDGLYEEGELDPTNPADDVPPPADDDEDGLTNAEELAFESDPNDADTDDDGVPDGAEQNWTQDTDADGTINVLDPDSDGDLVFDGTERGITTPHADTDVAAGVFVPDAAPGNQTGALEADTDHGGVPDGIEDHDRNGRVDAGEGNPLNPEDDDVTADTDGDGILDLEEGATDPDRDGKPSFLDLDSDGDSILDSEEAGDTDKQTAAIDSDLDGLPDYLDLDSDKDGIRDDHEAGDAVLETPAVDTELDGTPDVLDLDSDEDTIADAEEAGDTDLATVPVDSDADGTADFRDLDRDGDGILDRDEAGDLDPETAAVDTDEDGTPNASDLDSDGDGAIDAVEAGDTDPATLPIDTDGDGKPDFVDVDSDDDGVLDATDNCRLVVNADQLDADGDGRGNACENDEDHDGVDDERDNCPQIANPDQQNDDGDARGNACDSDVDGDGFIDDIGVSGGGCSVGAGGAGSDSAAVWLLVALLGLAVLVRRRS